MATAAPARAGPLDEAVRLVLQAHPVLAAERAALSARERQLDWSAEVTLSWTRQGTEYGGRGGPNAGVRVRIPLIDRSGEIEAAEARAAWRRKRDQVLRRFLSAVERIAAQAGKVRETRTMREFQRDRLEYREKRVDGGLAEARTLWGAAERVQQAEHDYAGARAKLETMLGSTARQYGGKRWKRLRALLAAHVKPKKR